MRGDGSDIGCGGGGRGDRGGRARPGSTIYVSQNGVAVEAPLGAKVTVSNNGRGLNIQMPGTVHSNGNTIRIMDPTTRYPHGYIRMTDPLGRYLDANGNIVARNDQAGHIRPK